MISLYAAVCQLAVHAARWRDGTYFTHADMTKLADTAHDVVAAHVEELGGVKDPTSKADVVAELRTRADRATSLRTQADLRAAANAIEVGAHRGAAARRAK